MVCKHRLQNFFKKVFFCFRIESNASIECLEEGRMIRSREI